MFWRGGQLNPGRKPMKYLRKFWVHMKSTNRKEIYDFFRKPWILKGINEFLLEINEFFKKPLESWWIRKEIIEFPIDCSILYMWLTPREVLARCMFLQEIANTKQKWQKQTNRYMTQCAENKRKHRHIALSVLTRLCSCWHFICFFWDLAKVSKKRNCKSK